MRVGLIVVSDPVPPDLSELVARVRGVTVAVVASRLPEELPDGVRGLVLGGGSGARIAAGSALCGPDVTHLAWGWPDPRYRLDDFLELCRKAAEEPEAVHKGWRTIRIGGHGTGLPRALEALAVKAVSPDIHDLAGLPCIVPRVFLESLKTELCSLIFFQARVLAAARRAGLPVREHPVTFDESRVAPKATIGEYWRELKCFLKEC